MRYAMAGRVVTKAGNKRLLDEAVAYVSGSIVADIGVASARSPSGFEEVNSVTTGGTIFHGPIEQDIHISYNLSPLWRVDDAYRNRDCWSGTDHCQAHVNEPMRNIGGSPEILLARYVDLSWLLRRARIAYRVPAPPEITRYDTARPRVFAAAWTEPIPSEVRSPRRLHPSAHRPQRRGAAAHREGQERDRSHTEPRTGRCRLRVRSLALIPPCIWARCVATRNPKGAVAFVSIRADASAYGRRRAECPQPGRSDTEMKYAVLSDLHISVEPGLFRRHEALASFLLWMPGEFDVLVLAGDTFDFLASPGYDGFFPSKAVDRMREILEPTRREHPNQAVVDALKFVVAKGVRVHLIPGNHDLECDLPGVQDYIRTALGGNQHAVTFELGGSPFTIDVDCAPTRRVACIAHGNMFDPYNRIDYGEVRRSAGNDPDKEVELCHGSKLVLKVVNRFKKPHPWVDQLPLSR